MLKQCVFSYLMFLKKQIGKAMRALLFDVFNGCSSSVKEINKSIWKGMSNIYYWEKLTSSKLSIFSERKFDKMH